MASGRFIGCKLAGGVTEGCTNASIGWWFIRLATIAMSLEAVSPLMSALKSKDAPLIFSFNGLLGIRPPPIYYPSKQAEASLSSHAQLQKLRS
jgi:hypothetical protein